MFPKRLEDVFDFILDDSMIDSRNSLPDELKEIFIPTSFRNCKWISMPFPKTVFRLT